MEFEVTNNINNNDKEQIYKGLLEYNLERLEDKNPKDYFLSLKILNHCSSYLWNFDDR